MPEWIIKYFGGGLLVILVYILISNTIWLLFGSKFLQALPGVNIKGVAGTLKIAILLIMTFTAIFVWLITWPFKQLGIGDKQSIQACISDYIQSASKVFAKRL